MSTVIDERVVSMQFDNTQFEKGVKQSINTLDSLKKSLDVTEATSGSNKALQTLNENVQSFSNKFSGLAMSIRDKISGYWTTIINKTEALVKSLSGIDAATQGWSKYESKVDAVQTIMAATGESIGIVSEQLERLNWFTDETSYNYTDMVSSLGKFTGAGLGIEESITALQGVATWAAASGVSANRASSAFYNISQAISAGAMKLQDWKSIELLNMSTMEFKQTAIDIAVEMGKLKKVGENTFRAIGASAQHTFKAENFNQYLSDGWFSTEVLMKTLQKYGEYADAIYEISDQYDTASEAMANFADESMALGEKAFKAAQEAKSFKDAIEATKDAVSTGWMTSFEMVIGNYEQAKETWTRLANDLWEIFASGASDRNDVLEKIFQGDKWSKIVESFEATGLGAESLQKILIRTAQSNGVSVNKMIEEAGSFEASLKEGWVTAELVEQALNRMLNHSTITTFDKFDDSIADLNKALADCAEESTNISEMQKNLGKYGIYAGMSTDILKKALKGETITIEELNDAELRSIGLQQEQINALKKRSEQLLYFTNLFKEQELSDEEAHAKALAIINREADAIAELSDTELMALGYTEDQIAAIEELKAQIMDADTDLNYFANTVGKLSGRELVVEIFSNALEGLKQTISAVRKAFYDIFPQESMNVWYYILEQIHEFSKSFILTDEAVEKLTNGFRVFFSALDLLVIKPTKMVYEGILIPLVAQIKKIFAAVQESGSGFSEWFIAFNKGEGTLNAFAAATKALATIIEFFGDILAKIAGSVTGFVSKIVSAFRGATRGAEEAQTGITGVVKGIGAAIKTFVSESINTLITAIGNFFKFIATGVATMWAKLTGQDVETVVKKVSDAFDGATKAVLEFKNKAATTIQDLWTKFKDSAPVQFIIALFGKMKERLAQLGPVLQNVGTFFRDTFGPAIVSVWTKATEGLATAFSFLKEKLVEFFAKAKSTVEGIEYEDALDGVNAALGTAGLVGALVLAFKWLGNVTSQQSAMTSMFKNISNVFKSTSGFIEKFAGIGESISGVFKSWQTAIQADVIRSIAVSVLMLAGACLMLTFVDSQALALSFGAITAFFAEMMVALKMIIGNSDAITKMGNSAALNQMTTALVKIAAAILVMSVAMRILGGMKPDQILAGTAAITAMSVAIFGLMQGTRMLRSNIATIKAMSGFIMAIAVAIFTLAIALRLISSIETKQMLIATGVLAALSVALMGMMVATRLLRGNVKSIAAISGFLIALAGSMLILGVALKIISSIDTERLAAGGLAMAAIAGAVLALMLATTYITTSAGKIMAAAGALVLISGAIAVVTGALWVLSKIETNWDSVMSLIAVLGAMTTALLALSNFGGTGSGKMLAAASAMIIMAVALNTLIPAIAALSLIPMEAMWQAIGGLAAVVGVLTVSMLLLSNCSIGILAVAAAFLLLASSAAMLGKALLWIGGGFTALATGVFALGALDEEMVESFLENIRSILVGVIAILPDIIQHIGPVIQAVVDVIKEKAPEIVNMLVTVFSQVVLGIIQLIFSYVPNLVDGFIGMFNMILNVLVKYIPEMCDKIVFLLGTLFETIFTIIDTFLMDFADKAPTIFANLGTILVENAKSMIDAADQIMQALVEHIDSLTESFVIIGSSFAGALLEIALSGLPKVLEIIGKFLKGILSLILETVPTVLEIVGSLIAGLLEIILVNVPTVLEIVETLLIGILESTLKFVPRILEIVETLILGILESTIKFIPKIVELIGTVLENVLNFIVEFIPKIVNAALDLVVGVVTALVEHVDDFVMLALEFIAGFMDGIAQGIPDVIDSAFNLIISFINGLSDAIDEHAEEFSEAVERLINTVVDAAILILENMVSTFKDQGNKIMESGLVQGIKDKIDAVKMQIAGVMNAAHNKISEFVSSFKEAGKNIIDGLVNGIKEFASSPVEAIKDLGEQIYTAFTEMFDINSPSRLFRSYGMYIDQGLSEGIDAYADSAVQSTESLGRGTVSAMQAALNELSETIEEGMDDSPVIRPIMDLSEIQNGYGKINKMFAQSVGVSRNMAVSAVTSGSYNRTISGENVTPNTAGASFNFTQNNYSPKSLSRTEIYRQTRNQFSQMKGLVNGV